MKIKFCFWSILLTLLVAGTFSSCSNKSKEQQEGQTKDIQKDIPFKVPQNWIGKRVPANADMVAVGNFSEVMKSAGGKIKGSKVEMPEWLDKLPTGEIDEALEIIEETGINVEACALFAGIKDGDPTFVMKLDDKKKFISYIEDEFDFELEEEGTVAYYIHIYDDSYYDSSYGECFAIVDDYAYYYTGEEPKENLSAVIADIKSGNYADTNMGKYIAQGNAAGLSLCFPEEVCQALQEEFDLPYGTFNFLGNNYLCMRSNLTQDELTIEYQMLDKAGKVIDHKEYCEKYGLNPQAKVSQKALTFMTPNEQMVFAVSYEDMDWDKVWNQVIESENLTLSEADAINLVMDYLQKVDGTIALGIGLPHGIEKTVEYIGNEAFTKAFSATMVIEVKDRDTAESLLNELADLLEMQGVPIGVNKNGISIEIPEAFISLYGEIHDNALVFATHKIEKTGESPAVKAINFTDYASAAAIVLPKEHEIMKELGIDNDITLSLGYNWEDMGGIVKLNLKGAEGKGFIEKLFNVAMEAVKGTQKLERKFSKSREYNDYKEYYDYQVK